MPSDLSLTRLPAALGTVWNWQRARAWAVLTITAVYYVSHGQYKKCTFLQWHGTCLPNSFYGRFGDPAVKVRAELFQWKASTVAPTVRKLCESDGYCLKSVWEQSMASEKCTTELYRAFKLCDSNPLCLQNVLKQYMVAKKLGESNLSCLETVWKW